MTNYYDYRVYGEFAALARKKRIFPLFGLEIISVVDALLKGGIKVNDPGNPGRMYVCGKGVTKFDPVAGEAVGILERIKTNDVGRMKEMITKAARCLKALAVIWASPKKPPSRWLSIGTAAIRRLFICRNATSRRHFRNRSLPISPPERAAEVLAAVYGVPPKAPVDDAVKTQNEFRANLLRSGKPAFVVETFVSDVQARQMILDMGGIPCYPTLADGTSPICPYEETPEKLIENIRGMGIFMAEFIPIRNTPEVLSKYVKAMRAAGLVVVGGTEHNTLDLIPIEPTCLKSVPVPEDIKAIFWEGACVIAAHQFLESSWRNGVHGCPRQVECEVWESKEETRITDFAAIGASVIAKVHGAA